MKRSGDGSALSQLRAFTLIEMLTVIAVIGVLAGLIFPVVGSVKKHQYISHTQAEMAQLETAIDRYKATYGFYPPDNPGKLTNVLVNPLYFELVGTRQINIGGVFIYITLDGSAQLSANQFIKAFGPGVSGFMNCTKPGADEDAAAARNFLPELRRNQIATLTNMPPSFTNMILVASVGGPDSRYFPLGSRDVNPWRYNSSNPANNPGSYELWIQLVFAPGQTNLICNWTKQVQVNSPLP